MLFKVTAIKFDTDGDKKLAKRLEREWIGKTFEANDADDADACGADIISDESGFCIFSLEFIPNTKTNPSIPQGM
jgi:inosine/xanthosine triphosphate pyrophosphatase family protein